jgi:hypothetical protein
MSTEQEEKALGERMVEAEKKMKAPWPAEASMFADNVGVANKIADKIAAHERDREPTLSERLDQIEALLEQLLRRVG